IVWVYMIDGFSRMQMAVSHFANNYNILLKFLGYLIAVGPVTFLIRLLTKRWADDIIETNNSLKDAGKWIGILERVTVITLVLIGQFSAIGFLITAKSILRLIDKPETKIELGTANNFSSRKHTEYVLIGTFLSFGSAIMIGLIINWLMKK
ncbi:MAG: DUF3307 domain-containing protein, partial [Bacteroidota bacterium]